MRVAFVGCGFVADYYFATLANHPELELVGVYDRDAQRLRQFSSHFKVPTYPSLDALLADQRVELVVNLTNPRSHFEISKAALEAGKHVYSEKPLGMRIEEATELVALAARKGLRISSAPCSLLGETAQTVWKALQENRVGRVRLVYAEMDDGMVHRMPFRRWLSESGAPWPYRDEFEIGCTLEHAGYYLPWLTAFFGPARSVTAFSACLIPDKLPGERPLSPPDTPDFSVGCIQFASGVVARLTCGIVAPHDHGLKVIGDDGMLSVDDCWSYQAPVRMQRLVTIRRKAFLSPWRQRLRLVQTGHRMRNKTRGAQVMDFSRGVAALAEAIETGRRGRLAEDFSLHNTELALALHYARQGGGRIDLKTTFEPIETYIKQ